MYKKMQNIFKGKGITYLSFGPYKPSAGLASKVKELKQTLILQILV